MEGEVRERKNRKKRVPGKSLAGDTRLTTSKTTQPSL